MPIDPIFPGIARKNDGIFLYGAQFAKPFVFAYEQSNVEVVCGPSCKPEREVKLDRCIADNIPVLERRGGGGTVVLSPGVVVTVVVGERKASESALDIFDRIHENMIIVLQEAGIRKIQKMGISDLAIDGKKILGSSLYMGSNPKYYYYQSSIMVTSDLMLLERYLEHPPREPDYRAGRSHLDFCTTIKQQGIEVTASQVSVLLNRELQKNLTFSSAKVQ